MNREIKFRAWDAELKSVEYCSLYIAVTYYYTTQHLGNCIMQYTGLKDSEGKEIYEGDIITDSHYFMEKTDVVAWVDCGWSTKDGDKWEYKGFDEIALRGRFTVIGNIYENPDLIN